jgi:cation:H+ antiporter
LPDCIAVHAPKDSGRVHDWVNNIEGTGLWAAPLFTVVFLVASFLMIWRLNAMTEYGFEGTAVGTLVMPYCSGLANLIFVFVMGQRGGASEEVLTNAVVNNATNLTLLIGLPALLWGMHVIPSKRAKKREADQHRLNRLSLALTIIAAAFFAGVLWALTRDGRVDFFEGLVLVGLFAFWQCLHVIEVLKHNVRNKRSLNPVRLLVDFAAVGVGAWALYVSIDWLVAWISTARGTFFNASNLGWLSGWLMVAPNAMLALYYGWRRRADIVYSSQVGDGHICIPLGVGIYALFAPIRVTPDLQDGLVLLAGVSVVHLLFVSVFGQMPRWMGFVLIAAYGWFLYRGLIG